MDEPDVRDQIVQRHFFKRFDGIRMPIVETAQLVVEFYVPHGRTVRYFVRDDFVLSQQF
jgi:hypothetical protein